MADIMDTLSPLLSKYLPILEETQFSLNKNYRRGIITDTNLKKFILTEIEKKTIYWLSVGKSLEDIALMYDNKISTVKSRMKVIRNKLKASTNIQVIAIALKHKLV
jgi:DNA-binding NarL/FixJ family response regulator